MILILMYNECLVKIRKNDDSHGNVTHLFKIMLNDLTRSSSIKHKCDMGGKDKNNSGEE